MAGEATSAPGQRRPIIETFSRALADTQNFCFAMTYVDAVYCSLMGTCSIVSSSMPINLDAPGFGYAALDCDVACQLKTDAAETAPAEPLADMQNAHRQILAQEIGHLPSMRRYLDSGLYRQPRISQIWIDQLVGGNDLGVAWCEIPAPRFRLRGTPGR